MNILLVFAVSAASALAFASDPKFGKLKLYPGYKVSLYAEDVDNARSLATGKDGVVFVGSRKAGKVYALLPDKNSDGKSDGVKVIAKGLNSPNGVAYKNGDLFIAEISRILVIRDVDKKLDKENKPEPWGPSFPKNTHHGWKFIAFGPDGWLYVPVGAPCNICLENPDLYAAIHKIFPDGKKRELVAKGVRNTVGFDWHPKTRNLWFTDNGRDWMGDEIPPDELNKLTESVSHFGFPHCHGDIPDPEFGKDGCQKHVKPVHKFPAHAAALGMRFLKKQPGLENSVLVALHGSWNRSVPVGYKVVLVKLKENGKTESEDFLSGFLMNSSAWGRPVDVQELTDGSILVSDDKAGAVYRITKNGA